MGMSDENPEISVEVFGEGPMPPTRSIWLRHIALLAVTVMTSTMAGVLYPFGILPIETGPDPQTFGEAMAMLANLPLSYAAMLAGTVYLLFSDIDVLAYGLSFSLSLIFILLSHEMGHYIACRIYRVDATLPFFIPTPPLIGPAGTFGAFIKIRSPFPSRKSIFDIGVAGPIAGFIALLPIAVIGLITMKQVPTDFVPEPGSLVFADPLLMKLIAFTFGIDLNLGFRNPFYFAAWVGLLVTALNLIPSGQLDGGHALFAVFGERIHFWSGRLAFVLMAALSVLGFWIYNSPSGFLIAILLGVMMRFRHPHPLVDLPLDGKRKAVALITFIIFILSFSPFPIQII